MVWALCLGIGLCSGFLAGLLGVGGGTVVVPALLLSAQRMGFAGDDAMTVAAATSLAIVIPTSIASARAHAARGAIDWLAFRRLAPGVATGSLAGTLLAGALGGRVLLGLFVAFALLAMRQLLARPAERAAPSALLPGALTLAQRGLAIGLLSALAGVGGGLLSVPLLAHYLPLRRAIGTAALLGLPLAVAGLAGYLLPAHGTRCAAGCLGYVFLPAALAISLAASATAPLGAWLAHRAPVGVLKRAFAVLLLLVAADLCRELLR